MSRWTIEKSGTGIEKSGTGIEKSGTGIERAGTGIKNAGFGIEKSGTGIRRGFLAFSLATVLGVGSIEAAPVDPAGTLTIIVQNEVVTASWMIDDSVFSGVSLLSGTYASLMLTEVSLGVVNPGLDVTGNGTGSSKHVTGNGTGSSTKVTGNGTGSSVQVTGNGTGSSVQVTGNGTGSDTQVTGNGTGSNVLVTGNGTGSSVLVTGNGTGSSILVTGNGTGANAITLPNGTGISMEVSIGCGEADVTIVGDDFIPIAEFKGVQVSGSSLCDQAGIGLGLTAPFERLGH